MDSIRVPGSLTRLSLNDFKKLVSKIDTLKSSKLERTVTIVLSCLQRNRIPNDRLSPEAISAHKFGLVALEGLYNISKRKDFIGNVGLIKRVTQFWVADLDFTQLLLDLHWKENEEIRKPEPCFFHNLEKHVYVVLHTLSCTNFRDYFGTHGSYSKMRVISFSLWLRPGIPPAPQTASLAHDCLREPAGLYTLLDTVLGSSPQKTVANRAIRRAAQVIKNEPPKTCESAEDFFPEFLVFFEILRRAEGSVLQAILDANGARLALSIMKWLVKLASKDNRAAENDRMVRTVATGFLGLCATFRRKKSILSSAISGGLFNVLIAFERWIEVMEAKVPGTFCELKNLFTILYATGHVQRPQFPI